MSPSCPDSRPPAKPSGCGCKPKPPAGRPADDPLAHFDAMIPNALAYAQAAKAQGKPIVGIMCEFTPRELIIAAGGVPVCLCGGAAEMIPPAESVLPSNLCPLIKSTFGYHLQHANPFLEMASMVVAETTCDGKKKMYELMAQDRPMYVLELPQKPDDPHAFEHWLRELEKLKAELERRFNVRITDEKLRDAIAAMNRDRALRRELAALMKAPSPPFTGRQLLQLKSVISAIPEDLAQYEKALALHRSGGADIPVGGADIPVGGADIPVCHPSLASRVRVLLTGVPVVHGAERVVDIIEDNGGLVVCSENCTGVKPILEDVDASRDPLRAIAEKYFHLPCSVMTPNTRRMDSLERLVAEYRPHCIVELIWQACLTYDVEAARVKKLAGKLGLPYLRIETDYSPSDSARIAVRVQALFETVSSNLPDCCAAQAGREKGAAS
jgi:benzoyl-CoA reductase/2-hydroxyglutaryl-CoA dehydratase subunit BcrC/BadD/HgdB